MIQSINKHRLAKEPLEQAFVDQWETTNKDQRILSFVLDRSFENRGNYWPTDVEQEVAVTLIQWLGSPCGQHFLEQVNV